MEKLKCPSLGEEELLGDKGVELWRIAGGVPNHRMGPYLVGALKG